MAVIDVLYMAAQQLIYRKYIISFPIYLFVNLIFNVMNTFSIEYHNDAITIEPIPETPNEQFRLRYRDGRWLVMGKRPGLTAKR